MMLSSSGFTDGKSTFPAGEGSGGAIAIESNYVNCIWLSKGMSMPMPSPAEKVARALRVTDEEVIDNKPHLIDKTE